MTQGLATVVATLTAVGWWALFARTFRQRERPPAAALAWVAIVFAVWTMLSLLQVLSDDPGVRALIARGHLALGLVAPLAWWMLALRLADPPWLRRAHLIAFAAPAVTFGVATLVAPVGSPFLREVVGEATAAPWRLGPALWAGGVPYAYLLLAGAALLVLRLDRRRPDLDGPTIGILVAAMALPALASAAHLGGFAPFPGVDLTGVALGIAVVLLLFGVADAGPFDRQAVAHEAVFEAMPEPALVVASDGTIVDANPAARRMPFAEGADLRGVGLLAVAPQLEAARRSAQRKGDRRVLTGDLRGLEVAVSHLHDARGRLTGSVLIVHDRREDRAREEQLRVSTHRDGLTGATNRRGFETALEKALARRGERAVGVAFLDLDGFKGVNDAYGHAAGDDVLIEVVRRLQATVREGDVVARLGGDEFALLLPQVTPVELATAGERVGEALRRPIEADGQSVRIGASIGLASAPRDGTTVASLLAASDARMYRQKEAHAAARGTEAAANGAGAPP